ncbi:alpha/beta hydrolase [uncultured Draconibacterium sp.]|uniref:alpha/beta hydrolase family protein n=1 Tax=uncultured Draconibacterium sp. TaxID=1573823 RepID=UPI00321704CD
MKKALFIMAICMVALSSAVAQSKIEKETFVYSEKDGQELLLDKYVDNSIEYDGKRPVMIYVHGGGFATGSKINALQIKYNKHFAAQGFVSIAINYRLGLKDVEQPSPEIMTKAIHVSLEDLLTATAFIIEKADDWNIDTEKIMISGGSAGAITCLNAEYEICAERPLSKLVPAGFNYAGVVSQAGCVMIKEKTLEWKKTPCPILFMHGDKDMQVPFESMDMMGTFAAGSNYLHKQFVENDFAHWLYVEEGADHIVALKPLQYNFGEIDTFIDRFVMNGEHAIVRTYWKDEVPGSMAKMFDIVPLYMTGWEKTDEEVEAGEQ